MKNFRTMTMLLIALLAVAVAKAEPVQRISEIQSPLFNVPAIVPAGQSFPLKLKVENGAAPAKVFLSGIDGQPEEIELAIKPAASENGLTVFTATVPAGTPEALYNLSALIGGRTGAQPHAVKVIKEFKKDFDFIQITDIHFNVQDVRGQDMNRIRRWILTNASKENAEFIIITGDLGLDPETYPRDYAYSYPELTTHLRLPVFIVPGNHELYYAKLADGGEIDGAQYWAANYGPARHSFDYGAVHFIGINTFDWPREWRDRRDHTAAFSGSIINSFITPEQWQWIQDDLNSAQERGKSCVAYTHIPVSFLQGGKKIGVPPKYFKVPGPDTKQFADFLGSKGCEYIFVGHMHYEKENKLGSLTEVLTGSAGISSGKDKKSWQYRIIHVREGKVTGWENRYITFEELD